MIVVAVSGGFDPLNGMGHVTHIQEARKLGDRLVVILSRNDQLIAKGNKPNGTFYPSIADRIAIIREMRSVDEIVINLDQDLTCAEALRAIKPQIFAKGGGYNMNNLPKSEIDVCQELGIEVVFDVGLEKETSSSELVRRQSRTIDRYKDTLVLIPTLNEAGAIGQTIDDVHEHVPKCLVVVADSYSNDGTQDIARDRGATVIDAPRGGKGIAVRTIIPKVLQEYPCKWLVMLDGDFTYPAQNVPDVIAELEQGADVVLGYRNRKEEGAMSRTHALGNWGMSLLASMLYGVRVKDVCTGMWGFRAETLKGFVIRSNQFTLEVELFVNTVRGRYRMAQIPIGYRARPNSSNTKLKISDAVKIGWFLVSTRVKCGLW